jgi:hypothetical protein
VCGDDIQRIRSGDCGMEAGNEDVSRFHDAAIVLK